MATKLISEPWGLGQRPKVLNVFLSAGFNHLNIYKVLESNT